MDESYSSEFLQAVLDSAAHYIQAFRAVRDEAGRIIDFEWIYTNKAWNERFGERKGRRLLAEQPAATGTGLFRAYAGVVETGLPETREQYYNETGLRGWLRQTAVQMQDGFVLAAHEPAGKDNPGSAPGEVAAAVYASHPDSWKRMQQIIDAPNVGITVMKAVRDENGAIVDFEIEFVNHRTLQAFGGKNPAGVKICSFGSDGTEQLPYLEEAVETGVKNSYTRKSEAGIVHGWYLFSNAPVGEDRVVQVWEDITEIKKAEQEIHQLKDEIAQRATDKYYSIFNSIDEGFCICELVCDAAGNTVDFRWLEVNPAYEKQTGLKDVVGRLASDVMPGTERHWMDVYEKVARTGEAAHFENWHEPTRRWYYTFSSRIGGPGSRQVAVLFADITERRLQENRQKFLLRFSDAIRDATDEHALVQLALAMVAEELALDRCYVVVMDAAGDRADMVRQFYKPGLSAVPETLHRDCFSAVRNEAVQHTLLFHDIANDSRLGSTAKRMLADMQYGALIVSPARCGEGNPVWCIAGVSGKTRYWTSGEVMLMQEAAGRTWAAVERVKMEEALRKSEAKFRRLSESGIVAIAYFDLEGAIVDANDAFLQMLGLTKEALASGKVRWDQYTPAEWMPRTLQAVGEFKATGYISPYEKQFYHSGGALHWGIFAGATLGDGKTGVALVVDITERKKAEEALAASEKKLRELNENLELLVQKRTNELTRLKINQEKERLNAIILAQEQERARISEALHDGVAQLLYAAQSRLQLVTPAEPGSGALQRATDILVEAIGETRKVSFELMPPMLRDYGLEVCLRTLVDRVLTGRLRLLWDVGIKGRLSEKLEISVYRIFQEILNNILKHSRATEASIHIHVSARLLHLKVTDNGIGFVVKPPRGTYRGIGLQSIRNRTRLLNGRIQVTSAPGQGTVIELQLPLKEKK